MDCHEIERVERTGEQLVARCACGWRSGTATTGEAIGTEWDRHAAAARDEDVVSS